MPAGNLSTATPFLVSAIGSLLAAVYAAHLFKNRKRFFYLYLGSMVPAALIAGFMAVEPALAIPDTLNIALLVLGFMIAPTYLFLLHGRSDFHHRQALYGGLVYGLSFLGYISSLAAWVFLP